MSSLLGTRTCPHCSALCDASSHYCQQCGFPIGAISFKNEDPMVGKVLPGGYQILDLLGVGGMGRVYRAEQRTLGRTVAVKVIHPHLLADEKSLARFLTEARATSQLNHPNTVSVIDFGKLDDEKPYLVMEFLRGHNLAQVNNTDGPFEIPRIVNVLKQVLLALGEAHELQIIHRDLKPENIVLEPLRRGGDFVKVVDFGLAKLKAEGQSGITMPGIVCGTPDFMSPEQGRGDPLDGRSDLYAVGVVLYWLLTGRLPFESDSPTQVVLMHINNPIPNPRDVAPYRNIPDQLVQVLFKALAKSPADRYGDAHQFADALENCLTSSRPTEIAMPTRAAGTIVCGACKSVVPTGRFCLECGEPIAPSKKPEASSEKRPLPFLGRTEEMSWLRQQLDNAANRRSMVQLVGDPGSGKTRIVWEFLNASAVAGHPTVLARPDSYWAEVSGHVLRVTLRQLLGNPRERIGNQPELLAALDDLDGKSESDRRSPQARRQSFAKLLSWAVAETERDFQRAPIIAIDDFQRVDGLSRQALVDCAALQEGSALFVLAYQPTFAAPPLDGETRVVNGLPAHIATELLRHASGHRSPVVSLAEVGNRGIPPLYVEQVSAFGLDGGHQAPARLGDLIAHRLATLDPLHQKYVQVLAILGDDVTSELIGQMLEEPVSEPTLARLNELRLVRTSEHGSHSLWHPLFHDMTLHSIPVEARKELHRRALELFQDQDAPLEVLAEHASGSSDTMSALFYIEQMAARAQARGDEESETNALRNALDIARQELFRGQLEDPMRAIAIFGRRLGKVLLRRGQFSDAEGVLLEALDSTDERTDDRVEVLRSLAEVASHRDRHKDARRYVEEALRVASPALAQELQKDLRRMTA